MTSDFRVGQASSDFTEYLYVVNHLISLCIAYTLSIHCL